jgi:hypothetical protein
MVTVQKCNGSLTFALDDAYIHLAIAKNVALHGNWGISADRFSTASSSLGWTAATSAAFWIFGVHESVLWAFNVLAAGLALLVSWSILSLRKPSTGLMTCTLVGLILATPMVPLVFSGMEHLAQIVVSLMFLYAASEGLAGSERRWCGVRATTAATLLAPFVTAARYEGMFLIATVAALYVLRRQWSRGVAIAVLGMLPVVVAGIWFMSQGWFFLPASVVLKGRRIDFHSLDGISIFVRHLVRNMRGYPHVSGLMVVVAVSTAGLGRRVWHETAGLMGIVFLTVATMHTFFAGFGWFYRYEAYLVYLGLMVLVLQWLDVYRHRSPDLVRPRYRWALPVLFVALGLPMSYRAVCSLRNTPRACANIHDQQVQMARFLHDYYTGATVAANDVGAINFLADIDCVDLYGLADVEVARAKLAHLYDSQEIDRVARSRGATIAIIYKRWFEKYGGVPDSWIEVASFSIPDNMVCGDSTVTLYAVDVNAAEDLRTRFAEFKPSLPVGVQALMAPRSHRELQLANRENGAPRGPLAGGELRDLGILAVNRLASNAGKGYGNRYIAAVEDHMKSVSVERFLSSP